MLFINSQNVVESFWMLVYLHDSFAPVVKTHCCQRQNIVPVPSRSLKGIDRVRRLPFLYALAIWPVTGEGFQNTK